jgi:formylglycine-generating enzyme required for sulfatase activity
MPGTSIQFEMVAIQGGSFQMGSSAEEPYRRPDEGPVRKVALSPFWMGRAEVSWAEYEEFYSQTATRGKNEAGAVQAEDSPDAVTGPTPPYGSPDQGWGKGARPAITMTHHAAMRYCEWLSRVTGKRYRLPTEAEWEYACRAGSTTPYFFAGDPADFTNLSWLNRWFGVETDPISSFAWYRENSGRKSYPPAGVKGNPWGLLNLTGNVKEFCLDWYDPRAYAQYPAEGVVNPRGPESGEEYVVRGGSFKSDAVDLRSAARDRTRSDAWLVTDPQMPKSVWWYSDCTDVGFRVVRPFEKESDVRESGGEQAPSG